MAVNTIDKLQFLSFILIMASLCKSKILRKWPPVGIGSVPWLFCLSYLCANAIGLVGR